MVSPGLFCERRLGQHGRGERAGHGIALLVDEEDPVGVTVEGESDVGTDLAHPSLEVDEILGFDRIGLVVRERPVELGVHDLEVERERLEDLRDDEPTHAVGGVGDDLERTERRDVDERADVIGERIEHVAAGQRAARVGVADVAGRPGQGGGLDVGQAGVLTDRSSTGAAQLDAVVPGRVVRRREHRARHRQ